MSSSWGADMTVTVSDFDTAYLSMNTDEQALAGWMVSYDDGSSYRESTSEPNQVALRQSPSTSSTTNANDRTMIMRDRLHAAGSFQCDGVANHSQESARHHVGDPTHEGSSSSGIKQHPLGTAQAYDTARAAFALDNSSLLGPPNMTSPTASTPLLNGSHTQRKKYICPFCNMGEGHTTREYTKRTIGTPNTDFTIGTPTSSSALSKTYKCEFQKTDAFDNHIKEIITRRLRRVSCIANIHVLHILQSRTCILYARWPNVLSTTPRPETHFRDTPI
ncbi:hypothetical protein BU25DRAFT_466174 [Macroventuria anomochaeta]|uniref:Uncharacterized protein n=1 Tax=Macroventuria anomochaeta TaxID=301207 RepID=A0ACB6S7A4_9PLEO|nr:uncharacterized protein BU25DRAFT_466174 [Macroventuria anomochaeta]KAF2629094.1 hypothetical protein BU25DRAFT_466174 [Macroventuria anomochaeta]